MLRKSSYKYTIIMCSLYFINGDVFLLRSFFFIPKFNTDILKQEHFYFCLEYIAVRKILKTLNSRAVIFFLARALQDCGKVMIHSTTNCNANALLWLRYDFLNIIPILLSRNNSAILWEVHRKLGILATVRIYWSFILILHLGACS